MSDATHLKTPAQAASPELIENGDTPSSADAGTHEQEPMTTEDRARATLRGELPPAHDQKSDPDDINHQFDPETGELLDEDPNAPAEAAPDDANEASEAENSGDDSADKDSGDEEDEEGVRSRKEPKRIRINRDHMTDRDFAIVRLADDQGITLAEAEKRLFGETQLGQPPAESSPASHTAEAYLPTSQEIEARIAELRSHRDGAAERLDVKALNALNDQLADLREQLGETRLSEGARRQADNDAAQDRFTKAEASAITRAIELYPESNREGSRLYHALNAKKEELLKSEPTFFHNPRWPLLMIVDVATDLGIAAAPRGAGKIPGLPASLAVPKKATRPVPMPADGASTSAGSRSPENALAAELKTATASRDVDAIKAVMRKIDAARRR